MAGENVGSIYYNVNMDTGSLLAGERRVDKSMQNMQSTFNDTDKSAAVLGGGLNRLAQSFAAVASAAAIASEFRKAINVTMEFNATISNLSALTGAVGKDLAVFRQAAIDIGGSTSLSASQAAEAMKLIGGASPDLLKSADALKAVTQDAVILAEAAGVTLPEAATALTATLNQFQLSADESTRVINVLAAGAKEGSSEIANTVQVLQNAGVVAAQAGISFESFNGAVQALAKGEIKGAEAGTALRNVITILNTQMDKNLRPTTVGLSQALENLEKKNLSQVEAVKLFGRENITAASTLIQFRGEMDRVTTAVTGTDEAIRQAKTNMDNLKGDVANLSSAYETLQIAVGDLSDGALRGFVQQLTAALSVVANNEEAISGFFDTAGIAAQSFAAIIAGKVVMAMYGYSAAIAKNTAAQLTARTAAVGFSSAVGASVAPLSAATVAMNVSAMAARGLRTAMALLGGPAGVILLAGMAIYEYTSRSNEAKPSTDALTASVNQLGTAAERAEKRFNALLTGMDKLNKQELSVRKGDLEDQLRNAEGQLKSFERQFAKGVGSVGMVEGARAAVDTLRAALEKLNAESVKPAAKTTPFGGEDKPAKPAKMTDAEKSADAIKEQVKDLQMQADTLGMTASELEIYKLQLAGATDEQIRAAQSSLSLVDAYEQQEDAAKAAAKAEEDKKAALQTALMQADPIAAEQSKFKTEIASLKALNEAKLLEDQRYLELKMQAEAAHDAQMAALQEENFRRQSYANELLMASLDQVQQASTNALVGLVTGATNGEEAIRSLAGSILNEAVGALVKMGIEQVKAIVMGQTAQAAAAATAAATGAAMATSYAPAAAAASVASFGGAAGAGLSALASAIPAAIGLFSGRALGGPVQSDQMYRVNETGSPEIFNAANGRQYMMPNQRGEVVSNKDATSGGGANVVVNITNNTGAQVTQTERTQDDSRIIDIVVGDMMANGKSASAVNQITGTRRPGR